ncbi:carbamate kinase [Dermabacteraceae bacterium P13115]|nr:carbamate kinase [Dermabacteraceae bacterium TAE3-ERU27]MBV7433171.1 carbamate kinase [Dermabacteraceae bacterium TAE3-ERU5]
MSKTLVIAVGGNALPTVNPHDTSALEEMLEPVIDFAEEGMDVVLTYGNGPQVGVIYEGMLDLAQKHSDISEILMASTGAMSEGSIGSLLRYALRNICLKRNKFFKVTSVISHTLVDHEDPAFANPTKPVGRFLSEEEAERMRAEGRTVIEDSGRGYRWVVPSPKPQQILEFRSVRTLMDAGHIVLACGGGGIPTVRKDGREETVEAVIDKDAASALLAHELKADSLFLVTGVPQVAVDFGKPTQRWVDHMTRAEALEYIEQGQFPAGSMLPKMEAALNFVENNPNGEALITSIDCLAQALRGETGTRITLN